MTVPLQTCRVDGRTLTLTTGWWLDHPTLLRHYDLACIHNLPLTQPCSGCDQDKETA